ncbi:hypothetical protein [Natrinema salsiterrestre]|uniref:Peptidase n=1 Tax=Natrinema salsiterrestre TaxID=2950540 RepID=A0A9Q4Q2F4_9EURY|nr:hypothetical protein [Natrinema salsiterrestre]MDF9748259.1 hypothetical protein [Natrinema salsiterrestre]
MLLALQISLVLAFLFVTLPTYWVLSRLALRTSAPTVWIRRLLITLVPFAGGAYLLFMFASVDDLARGLVATLLSGFVPRSVRSMAADVAAQVTLFFFTGGVILAAYAVVVPAIRDAREIEVSTWTAVRRMGRYIAVLAVLLTIFFVPFVRVVTGEDLGLAPLTLILILLVLPFVSPVLPRLFRSVRDPGKNDHDRFDSLCERAGLQIDDIWILTDADETVEIYIRGLPGRRYLYISEFALKKFDDETLGALLAANAGSIKYHYRAIKTYPLFTFLIAGVATLAWGSPLGYTVLIALALLLPLPILWAARRAVHRADDYAAAQVGYETVADALEEMATEQNLDMPSKGMTTIVKSRPPLQERINRLRDGNRLR